MRLCVDHARFERSTAEEPGLEDRLRVAAFGPAPLLDVWVVETPEGALGGYATATAGFSTWSGRSHLHMDGLYLDPHLRGRGWGRRLMEAVFLTARERGLTEVQWQTPDWNLDAIRFYERGGASGTPKVRFRAAAASITGPPPPDGR